MFTYIDPSVRKRLIEQHKLVRIDSHGQLIAPDLAPPEGAAAINLMGPIPLPVKLGEASIDLQWYPAVRHTELSKVEALAGELREQGGQRFFSMLAESMAVNSVLVHGDLEASPSPLVRVHSSCLTGDVFGSQRCECGPQYLAALDRISQPGQAGMIVYMAGHEGRGIGLWAKAATYLLQDAGEDTYGANQSLGLPADCRDFSDASALLHYFIGDRPFRLMTNNPKKLDDLASMGHKQVIAEKHVVGVGQWNRRYLAAKRERGHQIGIEDLNELLP